MSIKLNGSLKYFPLINVFDFLISPGSTGMVCVETDEKKGGAYLEEGKVVHAYYKNLFEGEEAFFKLFTVAEGNFYFNEEKMSERSIKKDTKDLMHELTGKISSWEELKKIVPSEYMCFKLIPVPLEFKQAKILLSREQWLILTRLDGSRSVAEIAEELSMELLEISEIIVNFFKMGYVQPVDVFETKEIKKSEKSIEASIFSGDLKSFPLLSVLEFLSRHQISGRLKLSRGIYQGEVYMDKGHLLHASNNIWEGEMGLVDLLSWVKGRFSFIPILPEFNKSMTTPVEKIIATGGENLDKWRKIQGIITTPEIIFAANITGQEKDEDEKLTFTRRHWKVMYNIDGATTIRRMAEKLKFKNIEVADIIYTLYKDGLVEPVSNPYIEASNVEPDTEKNHNDFISDEKGLLITEEPGDGHQEKDRNSEKKEENKKKIIRRDKEMNKESNKKAAKEPKETVPDKVNKPINIIKEKFDDLISIMEEEPKQNENNPFGFLDR